MNFKLKLIIVAIVCLMIGGMVGVSIGAKQALNWCVDTGLHFVDIDINEQMLKTAIYQYQNQIGGCLFTDNGTHILSQ